MSQSNLQLAPEQDLPFQLRGSSFAVMVLKILRPDDPSLFPQLANKIRQAPSFFQNAPVVLDLEETPQTLGVPELSAISARLRQLNLLAIGVQGVSASVQKAALAVGLPLMPAGRQTNVASPSPVVSAKEKSQPVRQEQVPEASSARTSLLITEPVRSGQQIYAPKGDLVIVAPVSAGAELLADGNIHVYGPLRGRALAGLGGDSSARIFCQSLEAELISVAGLYRVSEDIDRSVWKKSVQVFLKNGYLQIEQIS